MPLEAILKQISPRGFGNSLTLKPKERSVIWHHKLKLHIAFRVNRRLRCGHREWGKMNKVGGFRQPKSNDKLTRQGIALE